MASGEVGASTAIALHLLCGLGLTAAYWLAVGVYGWSLVTDPAQTLHLLLLIHGPIVIGVHSYVRRDPERCSYWKAVARGILGLPVGALLNAFGAIVLGAPVGIKYLTKTLNWSLLMSLFTFVPAVCVFGSSRTDWQHILSHSKPTDGVDYMISLPAHGAVIGAWLGAWPMPLDWERPWQPEYVVLPPPLVRPPGRPRLSRRRDEDEEDTQTKALKKCQKCGQYGHNKRTCKGPAARGAARGGGRGSARGGGRGGASLTDTSETSTRSASSGCRGRGGRGVMSDARGGARGGGRGSGRGGASLHVPSEASTRSASSGCRGRGGRGSLRGGGRGGDSGAASSQGNHVPLIHREEPLAGQQAPQMAPHRAPHRAPQSAGNVNQSVSQVVRWYYGGVHQNVTQSITSGASWRPPPTRGTTPSIHQHEVMSQQHQQQQHEVLSQQHQQHEHQHQMAPPVSASTLPNRRSAPSRRMGTRIVGPTIRNPPATPNP